MLAKLVYKPFSLLLGIGAQRVAGHAFESAYEHRYGLVGFWPGDTEPPPAKRIRAADR